MYVYYLVNYLDQLYSFPEKVMTLGIHKAIYLKTTRNSANIVITKKTTESHPKLPGTLYTAAKESNSFRIFLFFESCFF